MAHGIALNPKANFVDYYSNTANGNYNAMIATLTHNFAHQFQAQAQYTWAKAMDENSGPYEEDPYPFDVHAAYGRVGLQRAERVQVVRPVAASLLPWQQFAEENAGRLVAGRNLECA